MIHYQLFTVISTNDCCQYNPVFFIVFMNTVLSFCCFFFPVFSFFLLLSGTIWVNSVLVQWAMGFCCFPEAVSAVALVPDVHLLCWIENTSAKISNPIKILDQVSGSRVDCPNSAVAGLILIWLSFSIVIVVMLARIWNSELADCTAREQVYIGSSVPKHLNCEATMF